MRVDGQLLDKGAGRLGFNEMDLDSSKTTDVDGRETVFFDGIK